METSQVLDAPVVGKPAMEYADKGARFVNYIIDVILRSLLMYLINTGSDLLPDTLYIRGVAALVAVLVFTTYYIIFEYTFGKTPGKFITRTHVVTENGEHPTLLNIIGRSLCRIIPFDNVSFLFSFTGWHDTISKTRVVKDTLKP